MISIGLIIGLLIILAAILIAALSKPLNLNKHFYVKLFFALLVLTTLSSLFSYFIQISVLGLAGSLFFFFTIAFVILHSSEALGNKKAAIFLIIAFIFGLFSEAIAVQLGAYYYTIPTFFFGLVPFATPISWVILIYVSYMLTDLFLFGFGGKKPKKTDNIWYFVGMIILLSSISGFITVNLDMILDPVSVAPSVAQWIYIGGGPYFNVPLSNFLTWFVITVLVILIFRFYEAFSIKEDSHPELKTYWYIIIIYIFFYLFNAVKAYSLGKIELILIGTTTMAPFILIGLLAILLNNKRRRLR
ncbi:MAG: carotenoid biosynthesis protein [Methanobacterium sp.]|nr:carotenoid biosynthesis protein [Methanobacterium sp.]